MMFLLVLEFIECLWELIGLLSDYQHGCTYTSYFTSAVTPEVKVEWSSNSKSGAERSSDLEVGWDLEQWKCEMGLTVPSAKHLDKCHASTLNNSPCIHCGHPSISRKLDSACIFVFIKFPEFYRLN